jgi:hypothetical protein
LYEIPCKFPTNAGFKSSIPDFGVEKSAMVGNLAGAPS